MSVKVKSKGKTYMLNREEFVRYITNLVNSARAKRQVKEDAKAEKGE